MLGFLIAFLVYFLKDFQKINFDLEDHISHFTSDKNYSFKKIIQDIRPIIKELVQ